MKAEQLRLRQPVRVVMSEPGLVWVESLPKAGCARCASGKGCGGGIFARLFGSKTYRLPVRTQCSLPVGRIVYLTIPIDRIHRAALAVYFFPLLTALIGALMGQFLPRFEGELGSIVLAALGFISALAFNRWRFSQSRWSEYYQPEIDTNVHGDAVCDWPSGSRSSNV